MDELGGVERRVKIRERLEQVLKSQPQIFTDFIIWNVSLKTLLNIFVISFLSCEMKNVAACTKNDAISLISYIVVRHASETTHLGVEEHVAFV